MADHDSHVPADAKIAEMAKHASDLQSEADRAKNFQHASATIGKKMEEHPESITAKDASAMKSAEAKHTGVAQPPKGSLSSEADHLAAVNAKATTTDKVDPATTIDHKA